MGGWLDSAIATFHPCPSFFWLDHYHKQLQTLCSRVMPFLGKDGPSWLILVMKWVENTIPMSINLFLFHFFPPGGECFLVGGIFVKGSSLDASRSLSDPTLLGHFAGSTEGGAVFPVGVGGWQEVFFSKRLNMYLQQQQQQLYNLKQILNEFVFCLVSFCFLFKFGKDKHDPRRSKTRWGL